MSLADNSDSTPIDVCSKLSGVDESSTEGLCVWYLGADPSDNESSSKSSEPPGLDDIYGVAAQDVQTNSWEDARTDSQSSRLDGADEIRDSYGGISPYSLQIVMRRISINLYKFP